MITIMDDTTDQTDVIGIAELGKLINRLPHTIREWELRGRLPKELRAARDGRNRRYWTRDQADKIKTWMREERLFPGSSLAGYDPSDERLDEHLNKLRKPGSRTPEPA